MSILDEIHRQQRLGELPNDLFTQNQAQFVPDYTPAGVDVAPNPFGNVQGVKLPAANIKVMPVFDTRPVNAMDFCVRVLYASNLAPLYAPKPGYVSIVREIKIETFDALSGAPINDAARYSQITPTVNQAALSVFETGVSGVSAVFGSFETLKTFFVVPVNGNLGFFIPVLDTTGADVYITISGTTMIDTGVPSNYAVTGGYQ